MAPEAVMQPATATAARMTNHASLLSMLHLLDSAQRETDPAAVSSRTESLIHLIAKCFIRGRGGPRPSTWLDRGHAVVRDVAGECYHEGPFEVSVKTTRSIAPHGEDDSALRPPASAGGTALLDLAQVGRKS